MKKIFVDVTVRLTLDCYDNVNVSEVIQEMDYDFNSQLEEAEITNTEIIDYDIIDVT